MEQYRKQIERVWKEAMTPAEKKALLDDLLQHEAAWKAMLEQEYYQHLQEGIVALPIADSARLLSQLHAKIGEQQVKPGARVVAWKGWVKWAVAAAVVGLVLTALFRYTRPVQAGKEELAVAKQKDSLLLRTNKGMADEDISLPDGSVVTLSPGSSIRYYALFTGEKRDISLLGMAWFSVAKDAARPFTVYARDISTTALGTRFMVSTLEENKVSVRLFEGKVVVKSTNHAVAMKDVYLKPGEEFGIDQRLKVFAVKQFEEQKAEAVSQLVKGKQPEREKLTALEFTQTPLSEVLAAISKRYKVQFIYDEQTMNHELVTGKFLPSDSLPVVLSILGTVNGLSFRTDQQTITVSKIK